VSAAKSEQTHVRTVFFNVQVDCESTQHALRDPGLGERAIRGLGEVFAQTGVKGTFLVIPGDLRAHGAVYRELQAAGHEIGLHVHPADQGYEEFLGVYSAEDQARIVAEARDAFCAAMDRPPRAIVPGYGSANDHTFPVFEALGFTHGHASFPTRDLPQCACVWGSSPRGCHYPHRYNRCLEGDVDFVDIPPTIDAQSRMWGGRHPQDLRVELVDAKNHWYTIDKDLKRQVDAGEDVATPYIRALTHNVFEYGRPDDFRRETLLGIIQAVRERCEAYGCRMQPATLAEIAEDFRAKVPRPKGAAKLTLDTRGRKPGGAPEAGA